MSELFELILQIGTYNGEVYSIKKHDLEDFKVIIDRYGTEWSEHE